MPELQIPPWEQEAVPAADSTPDAPPWETVDQAPWESAEPAGNEFEIPPPVASTPRAPEEPGMLDMAARGMAHGTVGMAESVGTGIEYLGGKLDSDPLRRLGKDTAEYWEEVGRQYEAPESLQGSVLENPALMAKGSWWAYNVSAIVLTLAASVVPGMAGARAVQVFGKSIGWTPKTVEKLARLGGALTGGATGGALEGANTYREVLAKGGSEEEAASAAEQMTLASGLLNSISVDKFLKNVPPGSLSKLKARTVRGLTEGITEWLEGPAEAGILYQGEHIDVGEAVQKIKDELNVLGPAAVTGFFFPGAGSLPTETQAKERADAESAGETVDLLAPEQTPAADGEIIDDIDPRMQGGTATEPGEDKPTPFATQTPASTAVEKPEIDTETAPVVPDIQYFDNRLQRGNYRDLLQQAADNLVVGSDGELIPDPNYVMGESDKPGETPMVRAPSLNPDWFKSMMDDPDYKMPVSSVKNAVKKAIAGKKLGVRQSRVVAGILDNIQEERTSQSNLDYARAELEKARSARGTAGLPPADDWLFEEGEYPADYDGTSRALMELHQRAHEIGGPLADEADALLESQQDDETVLSNLAILLKGGQRGQSIETGTEQLPAAEETAGLPPAGVEPVAGIDTVRRGPAVDRPVESRAQTAPVEQPVDHLPSEEAYAAQAARVQAQDATDTTESEATGTTPAEPQQTPAPPMPDQPAKEVKAGAGQPVAKKAPGRKPLQPARQAFSEGQTVRITAEDMGEAGKTGLIESIDGDEISLDTGAVYGPDDIEVVEQPAETPKAKKAPGRKKKEAEKAIDAAAHQAATSPKNNKPEPTEAQKEAGNYKKGHAAINGLDITIENPAGSKRRPEWPALTHHYGYIKKTEGADGDHVDVFLTDNADDANRQVFVIDQVNPKTGRFDEHKVVLGASSSGAARNVYQANYAKDWKGLGAITGLSLDEFKAWLEGDTTKPLALKVKKSPGRKQPISEKKTVSKQVGKPRLAETESDLWSAIYEKTESGVVTDRGILYPVVRIPGEGDFRVGRGNIERIADGGVTAFPATKGDIAMLEKDISRDMVEVILMSHWGGSGSARETLSKPVEVLHSPSGLSWKGKTAKPYWKEKLGALGKMDRQLALKEAGYSFTEATELMRELFTEETGTAKSRNQPTTAPPSKSSIDDRKRRAQEAKIEDFGEVLKGARKHYAAAYADKMKEAKDADIASVPLSKSWPEPDYQKLLDGGADPWSVAFVHAARDEIPSKPRQRWKLNGFVEQVKSLRGMADKLLSDPEYKKKAQEQLERKEFQLVKKTVGGRADLYLAVGHEKSLKGISLHVGSYTLYKKVKYDPAKIIWSVQKKAKATAWSNWPTMLSEADTREQAIENFKKSYKDIDTSKAAKKEVKFSIWSMRGTPGYVIGKKVGKNYIKLKTFDGVKEARAYLSEHHDELVSLLSKYKEIPNERRPENSPRVGVDHRNGADVTPEQFSETFGFRGVQFGNYVEGPRRQEDLNEAYDALMDLAGVIDIPPKSISLDGQLGLAFGARGRGGKEAPKAHYEPETIVINLTKRAGAGSLAHEWWHGLDNYFSRRRGDKGNYLTERAYKTTEGVRPEMVGAFKKVIDAVNKSGVPKRSRVLDGRKSKDYWSTGREMTARSFETYVIGKLQDQGHSNDYLANIVSEEYWDAAAALGLELDESYPYPNAAELPAVRTAFDEFMGAIESKETDDGVALYSKTSDNDSPASSIYSKLTGKTAPRGITKKQAERVIKRFTKQYKGSADLSFVFATTKEQAFGVDARALEKERIKGAYYGRSGRVLLIGAEIASSQDAFEVLRHEIIGHHGLNTFEAADRLAILDLVKSSRKSIGTKLLWRKIDKDYAGASEDVKAQEVIAHLAQHKESRVGRLWNDLLILIRKALRRIGLIGDGYGRSDLVKLVEELGNRIRRGEPQRFRPPVDSPEFTKQQRVYNPDRLTPAERKFFESMNKADWEDLNDTAPSAKYEDGKFTVSQEDIDAVATWIDDVVIAREGERLPPSFHSGDFVFRYVSDNDATAVDLETPLFSKTTPGRKYTDAQRAAIEKGGFGHKIDTGHPLRSALGQAINRLDETKQVWKTILRQGFLDQYDSFRTIINDKRAWMMAELSAASGGVIEAALEYGQPFMSKGAVDVDTQKKSLSEILEPLGAEVNDWLKWIAGNRSERLAAEDRERLFEDVDIQALKSLNQGTMADGRSRQEVYEAARQEFEQLNDAIVKIGVDTGVISQENRRTWKQQGFYVPFYRILEDEGSGVQGPHTKGGLVRQTAYKRLKRADIPLGDLLTNVVMNWNHVVSAGLKNQAALKALESAEAAGLAEQVEEKNRSKDAVFVRISGRKLWYELEQSKDGQLVLESLVSLNYNGLNNFMMKAARKFKRLLTYGVTASPEFKIANLIRDSVQAIAVADISTNIAKNVAQGFRSTKKGNPTIARMIAGGGAFGDSGYIHGSDPEALQRLVKKDIDRMTILDSPKRIQKMWDAYQDFGARLENVNRAANFEQDLSRGTNLLEANFNARDHLDFQRTGAFVSIRALAQVVPFLNARMQGLSKLGRAGFDPAQRRQVMSVIGVYSLASILLYLYMKGDKDYDEAEQWERDTYHLFKIPGSDVMYRIPRPFEVGFMANIFERGAEQLVDDEVHGKLFFERLWHGLSETLSFNPMPQMFMPAVEIWANRNTFTGRPIESEGMRLLSPSERRRAWTSETAIVMSKGFESIMWDKVVLSPVQIEHLVKGYFGWIGGITLKSTDSMLRGGGFFPSAPGRRIQDYVAVGRFARTGPARGSRYTTAFYENMREANIAYNNIRFARDLGDREKALELAEKNKDKLAVRGVYNSAQKGLTAINKQILRTRANKDMDGAEKLRIIEDLQQRKNMITKRIIKRVEERQKSAD